MRIVFVLCLLIALALAFNPDEFKGVPLQAHKDELAELQRGIDTCWSQKSKLDKDLKPIQTEHSKLSNKLTSAQQAEAGKIAELKNLKVVKASFVKNMDEQIALGRNELLLIKKLKSHVAKIHQRHANERNSIYPLLQSMEDRINAEIASLQKQLQDHTDTINEKSAEKTAATQKVNQEQRLVNDITKIKNDLEKSIQTQNNECTRLVNAKADREKQIKKEIKISTKAFQKKNVPDSNTLYSVATFTYESQITTFDGLEYKFEQASGDYVFVRSWDNTYNIHVRTNGNRPTGVAVKTPGFVASIEEDLSVFVNGDQRSLPTTYKSIEIYESYVAGGKAIEIQLKDGTRIRMTAVGSTRSVYVAAIRSTFYGNSAALAGMMDGSRENDLMKSDHSLILTSRITKVTIREFIESWTAKGTSLFMKEIIKVSVKSTLKVSSSMKTDKDKYRNKMKGGRSNPGRNVYCSCSGDPHYHTFDGLYYHMIRSGDYIYTQNKAKSFVVQQRVGGYPAGNDAIAVYISGDVVEYIGRGSVYKINGKRVSPNNAGIKMNNGGIVYRNRIVDPRGAVVKFGNGNRYFYLAVYITKTTFLFDKTIGLCGSYDNSKSDDLIHEGKSIPRDSVSARRYGWRGPKVFGTPFKVSSRDSFFDVEPEKDTGADSVRQWKNDAEKREAEKLCKKQGLSGDEFESCVDDIQATGDKKMAGISKKSKAGVEDGQHRFLNVKPVLSLKLDEQRATRAVDSSASKTDGYFVGDKIAVLKGALDSIGGTLIVNKPKNAAQKEMTLGMWIKISDLKANANIARVNNFWTVTASPSGNKIKLVFTAGNTKLKPVTISRNSWYYLTVSYSNGDLCEIYVNGKREEFIESKNIKISSPPNKDNVKLIVAGSGLNIRLNSIRIYDIQLEADQIHGLYHIGEDAFSSVLGKMFTAKKQLKSEKQKAVEKKDAQHRDCLATQKQFQTQLNADTAKAAGISGNVADYRKQLKALQKKASASSGRLAASKVEIAAKVTACSKAKARANNRAQVEKELDLIKKIKAKFTALSKTAKKTKIIQLLDQLYAQLSKELKDIDAADKYVAACPDDLQSLQSKKTKAIKINTLAKQSVSNSQSTLSDEEDVLLTAQKVVASVQAQVNVQKNQCSAKDRDTQNLSRSYDQAIKAMEQNIQKILRKRKQ